MVWRHVCKLVKKEVKGTLNLTFSSKFTSGTSQKGTIRDGRRAVVKIVESWGAAPKPALLCCRSLAISYHGDAMEDLAGRARGHAIHLHGGS